MKNMFYERRHCEQNFQRTPIAKGIKTEGVYNGGSYKPVSGTNTSKCAFSERAFN